MTKKDRKQQLINAVGKLGEEIAIEVIQREAIRKHKEAHFQRLAPWDIRRDIPHYASYDYCLTIPLYYEDDNGVSKREDIVYLIEVKTKQAKNTPFVIKGSQIREYQAISSDHGVSYLVALVDLCSEKMFVVALDTLVILAKQTTDGDYTYKPRNRDGKVYDISHFEPCVQLRILQDEILDDGKTKSLFDPKNPL